MTKKNHLEFANFICRFGDNKVLLDLAQEVVVPAFTSNKLERFTGTSKFFFHEAQVIELHDGTNPVLGIIGRFVKDTTLSREQRFDSKNSRLIPDKQELQSAPSSIFVLILNNHRLLYLPETRYAPNLASFTVTIRDFIKQKHTDLIQKLSEENNEKLISKKEINRNLLQEFPPPSVEIIPLGSEDSLENFISRFDILEAVTIKLLATNNELDNNEFFKRLRQSSEEVGSKKTTLEYVNKEGLSKEAATSRLKTAVNQGNSRITFKGKDSQGDTLSGSNDKFKISIPTSIIPKDIVDTAKQMFLLAQQYLNRANTDEHIPKDDVTEKVKEIQVSLMNSERK